MSARARTALFAMGSADAQARWRGIGCPNCTVTGGKQYSFSRKIARLGAARPFSIFAAAQAPCLLSLPPRMRPRSRRSRRTTSTALSSASPSAAPPWPTKRRSRRRYVLGRRRDRTGRRPRRRGRRGTAAPWPRALAASPPRHASPASARRPDTARPLRPARSPAAAEADRGEGDGALLPRHLRGARLGGDRTARAAAEEEPCAPLLGTFSRLSLCRRMPLCSRSWRRPTRRSWRG